VDLIRLKLPLRNTGWESPIRVALQANLPGLSSFDTRGLAMTVRLTRLLAAVLLLAGGIVHYNLWKSGYRHVPTIGTLFLANFVASIALAAAVMLSRRAIVASAGIAFAAGSLAA